MVAPITSTIRGAPSEVLIGVDEGLKAKRPVTPFARASLEEEAAILEIVHAEPLLGAKRIHQLLHGASRCRAELSEKAVYDALKRHGLSRKEKRLEFAQSGSDKRMARLARALTENGPAAPANPGGGS